MNTWVLKVGMIGGAVVGIASELQKLPLPPKVQAIVGTVAGIAAIVAGLYHPTPASTPTTTVVTTE